MGFFDGLFGPAASEAWNWGQQKDNVPQIGENPYQSQWTGLIQQLTARANGQGGPSMAEMAMREGTDRAMSQQLAMTRGGNARLARQGTMNMADIGQGMAAGVTRAKTMEQQANQSALMQALQGGGNAWFQPQQANLQAFMQTPSNMQMLTGLIQQLAMAGAQVA